MYTACAYVYIYIIHMYIIYPPTSSRARACWLTLSSTHTLQSCRLQSATTAIPCNLTSSSLPCTYTAKCSLLYCFILDGVGLRRHRLPQAATGRLTFWAQMPQIQMESIKTNKNQWKQLPWMPLAYDGNELWAIGDAWHRLCHQSGPHGRSRRNSTTILNGFALGVFLADLKHSRNQKSVSKWNTNESETFARWQKHMNLKIKQLHFWDMQSAAKLRRESSAAHQISPIPILDTNGDAKKRYAAEAEPMNIYIYIHIYIYMYWYVHCIRGIRQHTIT